MFTLPNFNDSEIFPIDYKLRQNLSISLIFHFKTKLYTIHKAVSKTVYACDGVVDNFAPDFFTFVRHILSTNFSRSFQRRDESRCPKLTTE